MFFNMPKYHLGGRNKASEWNEVTMLSDQPNRVICNYCKESIIKKIERLYILQHAKVLFRGKK